MTETGNVFSVDHGRKTPGGLCSVGGGGQESRSTYCPIDASKASRQAVNHVRLSKTNVLEEGTPRKRKPDNYSGASAVRTWVLLGRSCQDTCAMTGRYRPKPVDHRIEKRPFNVAVLW